VRAGAILPLDPVRQYVDQPVTEATTIRIYRGADGHFVLYDDDGMSMDYLKGAGTWISFAWNDTQRKLEITLDSRTTFMPAPRDFNLVLMPENQRRTVTFRGPRQEVSFY
jgi:alpha-glucosidase (family GH31 glycosyl hydrolase)